MLSNFNEHLLVTSMDQLAEGNDVFAMMRNKLLNRQLSSLPSNTPEENLGEIKSNIKQQLANMTTPELVKMYTKLTGVTPKTEISVN